MSKIVPFIAAIFLSLSSTIVSLPSQTTGYSFVYLAYSKNGQGRVVHIDPAGKTSSVKIIAVYPINSSAFVQVSPDSNWVVVNYTMTPDQPGISYMRLVNFQSGEVRDQIAQDTLLLNRPDQTIAWSPDGRYLAFAELTGVGYPSTAPAYVYSVADNKLIRLPTSQTEANRFVWSADSTKLGIESIGCSPGACAISLDVIDIATQKIIESGDWSSVSAGLGELDVCNLQATPDMHYIAFVSVCDSSAMDTPKEVYVWDSQANKVVEVTTITKSARAANKWLVIGANYALNWTSPTSLLIGMLFTATGINPQCQGTGGYNCLELVQTLNYDVNAGKLSLFSNGSVAELATNPISNEIALTTIPSIDLVTHAAITVKTSIGALKADTITSASSLPAGEHLLWSPDGKWLAYKTNGNTFAFVDDASTQNVSYTFSDSAVQTDAAWSTTSVLPIGWVTDNP